MMPAAITTFSGVETAKLLPGRPGIRRARSPRRDAQDALALAGRRACAPPTDGATLVELDRARRRAARPLTGLEATARLHASDRPRARPDVGARPAGAAGPFQRRRRAGTPGNGTSSSNCRATASACSARATASFCAEREDRSHDRNASISRSSSDATPDGIAHMDLAVEGVGCAACIRKIEGGLKQLPGRRPRRGSTSPTAGWRSTGATTTLDAVDVIAALERIGYRGHPFEPERAESRRGAPDALADALPRGRGLRRDEHHAAVGVGLVRQRQRHDAGDARPLPLALGADRAAGRGLCGPAVLPQRAGARCGRGTLNMDVPISLGVIAGARHVGGRDRQPRAPRLFRFRRSCCCSSCCAAARSTTRCGARRARSPAISRR